MYQYPHLFPSTPPLDWDVEFPWFFPSFAVLCNLDVSMINLWLWMFMKNMCFEKKINYIIHFPNVMVHWVWVAYRLDRMNGWTCLSFELRDSSLDVCLEYRLHIGFMILCWACFCLGDDSSSINMTNVEISCISDW